MPRHSVVNNPAIFSIETTQTVFHLEFDLSVERGRINPQTALHIFRVHAHRPSVSQFLLHRTTGKIQPALIEKLALFVRSGHPDQRGSRIRDQSEARFALAQSLFGSLTIRDVQYLRY